MIESVAVAKTVTSEWGSFSPHQTVIHGGEVCFAATAIHKFLNITSEILARINTEKIVQAAVLKFGDDNFVTIPLYTPAAIRKLISECDHISPMAKANLLSKFASYHMFAPAAMIDLPALAIVVAGPHGKIPLRTAGGYDIATVEKQRFVMMRVDRPAVALRCMQIHSSQQSTDDDWLNIIHVFADIESADIAFNDLGRKLINAGAVLQGITSGHPAGGIRFAAIAKIGGVDAIPTKELLGKLRELISRPAVDFESFKKMQYERPGQLMVDAGMKMTKAGLAQYARGSPIKITSAIE